MKSEHPIYHSGELYLQNISGVNEVADQRANMMIVDHLQEQHQKFYSLLNCLYIASVDSNDKPWASIITGQAGFISSPTQKQLKIASSPINGDVLADNIEHNPQLGFLGLEHHTRRRNRMSGELISASDSRLLINIKQAFGNCPKHIQARESTFIETTSNECINSVETYTHLNAESKVLLMQADTFFISSYHPKALHRAADISHRGGKPGFIKIESDQSFSFNDYSGNNMYMTLGNLYTHPFAGLLFINYASGDVWQFQCKTEIIETPNNQHKRQLKLYVEKIRKLPKALNLSWRTIDRER